MKMEKRREQEQQKMMLKHQFENDIGSLESKIRDKEQRGKDASKYKIDLVKQKKEQEKFIKQQLHEKNMQKVKE